MPGTLDGLNFFGAELINAVLDIGLDIKRDLCQLILPLGRPVLDALKNFGEALCYHQKNIVLSMLAVMAGQSPSKTGVSALMSRPSTPCLYGGRGEALTRQAAFAEE
ncbi:hypothetical protein [Pseudolabrys sp. FHR47]|uniref:hypothetical protein n=1 Tax=Pseudolabrys sp. FHR47 TaxID=2562284 RepID=UPI00143D1409|nr:hypothetical protein [Pseudolabrys sp. FHR47]